MKQNIKREIMDTAKCLFIKKGFHDTSMRDIAAALNISVGNLTYHYKRKEDLIEAILIEDHQHYKKPDLLCSLGDLNDLLRRNTIQRPVVPIITDIIISWPKRARQFMKCKYPF